MARSRFRQPTILPGFGLTLGFTTFFLSVLVLMPLAALVFRAGSLSLPNSSTYCSTSARSLPIG